MKLVDVECLSCGHVQEDFLPSIGEPDLEPCSKCGSTDVQPVYGNIVPTSSSKAPNAGSGPWG